MLASTTLMLASLVALANAHFQMMFPPPRGPFVEDDEPNVCDGYSKVVNRTVFPLTGGFYTLNSEHASWVVGVTLSTAAAPDAFTDFTGITNFVKASGEGTFCLPLDLSKTNATGLQDGMNVTLEIVFDGGDGELFQCVDLTLSSNASFSNIACSNGTSSSSASGSATASGSSPSSTSPPPSSAVALRLPVEYLMVLGAALVGAAAVTV
ncbi:hypothetical protein FB45DRAFT_916328 [Roridomyces roridus]|uniref:Copper acquisition factor BIM1-like domain-containing protein n=1 Tax=Roridomyces roridus TaxID=1738132 RepID=A0AAD7BTY8_9AGAR|nr:hypothetical protein FB45DRAFT_916328 [Roridomyces roridus]